MSPQIPPAVIPPPAFPLVSVVVTDTFLPNTEGAITWGLKGQHPLYANMQIIRMFVTETVVEVFSLPTDKNDTNGVRNTIPLSRVRLIEEIMPFDVLAQELTDAHISAHEEDDDEDGDDEDSEPEENRAGAAPANGHTGP